jgi:LAO/AO transport system kinase
MSGESSHRYEMPGVESPPAINPALIWRPRQRPSVDDVWNALRSGDRAALSTAITWLESSNDRDQDDVSILLDRAYPSQAETIRLGITGVPGAGKSTLIETLGLHFLQDDSKQLAVLAVDPSSPITGGSILGDKSRMPELARHPRAFIRPSPARGTLGGVGAATFEAISLCEAAGMTMIIVETVGVGQSESAVRGMVDIVLLLMLTGAGDDLQGMKRGVLELADILAVTKADGENRLAAEVVAQQLRSALTFFTPASQHWNPPVLPVSVHDESSVDQLVQTIQECYSKLSSLGDLEKRRQNQVMEFTDRLIAEQWRRRWTQNGRNQAVFDQVATGELPPRRAAHIMWEAIQNP